MNRLAELLNEEHPHKEEVTEPKWLGNMSTKELADAYEEVQRELEMENDNE